MNPAHLHIILNHIPVIGIPFGIAILSYAFLRKNAQIRTLGLLVFVVIALITIPTYLAGKAAEDTVEDLPGVEEHLIENHERAATIALVATSVLGGLALIRLLVPARFSTIGGPLTILVFVLSLGVAGGSGELPTSAAKFATPKSETAPRPLAMTIGTRSEAAIETNAMAKRRATSKPAKQRAAEKIIAGGVDVDGAEAGVGAMDKENRL